MKTEGLFEEPVFSSSARALAERRFLLTSLRALSLLLVGLSLFAFAEDRILGAVFLAVSLALCISLMGPLGGLAAFGLFSERELTLKEAVIGERRGRFTRFLLFEQISHLKVLRDKKESILAL